jgi:uncharacterized protein YfaP (DUF2135 family)
MNRGDRVTFVDANGSTHEAEVRNVFDANDPHSAINLHVLNDPAETQERTSVANEANKQPGAAFWRAK